MEHAPVVLHEDGESVVGSVSVESLPDLLSIFIGGEASLPEPEHRPFWDVYVLDPDGGDTYLHVGTVTSGEGPEALHYASKAAVELPIIEPGYELFLACRIKSYRAAHLAVTAVSKDYEILG